MPDLEASQEFAPGALDARLRLVRVEIFGDDGVDRLAEHLGLTPERWRNVEQRGGLIKAEELLAFTELTGANPVWLLRGDGTKYRTGQGPREGSN